jgi:hypothetical protein
MLDIVEDSRTCEQETIALALKCNLFGGEDLTGRGFRGGEFFDLAFDGFAFPTSGHDSILLGETNTRVAMAGIATRERTGSAYFGRPV